MSAGGSGPGSPEVGGGERQAGGGGDPSAGGSGGEPRMAASRRWFRLLLRLYPVDFRGELGEALVDTYVERAREALRRGGRPALGAVWLRALFDSLRNGAAERLHPAAWWRRGGNWRRDAELVVRRLVRAPVFVLAVLGTLTVGLGAFAVVYTVVHKVLLAPLPYEAPEDLYWVWRDYRAFFDLDRGWAAGTDVAELARAGGVIEDVAALRRDSRTLGGIAGEAPSEVRLMLTTPNLFGLLGVGPVLGRAFLPEEGGPGRVPVIVLTHALWNRLGADERIIGREIRLDGEPFTVIGVLGRDFEFVRHGSLGPPDPPADAYITFDFDLAGTSPNQGAYGALLRARAGTTQAVVETAVDAVGRIIDERDFGSAGMRIYAVALGPDLVAHARPALLVVGLAGGFLVLVLLANLGSLLLVRVMQREKEIAVSRALGANGAALVRATLLEGGLLGLLGGIGGALASVWATQALVGLAPVDLPRRETIAVDWPIALVVVGTGALLGLLASTAPAVWATRARLSALLNAAAVRGGGGHGRMRRGMVVVQVALSLVLLSAGGLVVRSFERLLRADPGFDAAGVLTLRVPISGSDEEAVALQERLQRELGAIPGVTAVGAASTLPLSGGADQSDIEVPGAPGNTGDPATDQPLVDVIATRRGWFEALRMRVLEGRTFEVLAPAGVHEALIDEQLARQFFPSSSAIGAEILVAGTSVRVIGVVRHARLYDVHADGRPQVYYRSRGEYVRASLWYAIRSERDPRSLVSEVRAAIDRVDGELAMADVAPLEDVVAESLAQQRVSAVLVAGFSLGALLLAAMGLFGVVSGSVTRRRHELALRLALGADHGRVLRHVLGEGARLVALGVLIAVPGVYAAGRVTRGLLVGVSPWDPVTLCAVAFGLAAVALLACYLPARRVLSIEPASALRSE